MHAHSNVTEGVTRKLELLVSPWKSCRTCGFWGRGIFDFTKSMPTVFDFYSQRSSSHSPEAAIYGNLRIDNASQMIRVLEAIQFVSGITQSDASKVFNWET